MLGVLLLAVTFGTAQPAARPAGWTDVKPGMTRVEVAKAIGRPLLSNQGRGVEVWLYDRGGNIVFVHNRVDSWTPPAVPAPAPAQPETAAPKRDDVAGGPAPVPPSDTPQRRTAA